MSRKKSQHHRKPRSLGGLSTPKNISMVSINQHEAFHTNFSNMTVPEICDELNKVWIDPDYKIICVKRTERIEQDIRSIADLERAFYYELYLKGKKGK